MKEGAAIEGIARDTVRDKNRSECIQVSVDDTETLVVLDEISRMQVLVENPHFSEIVFN